MRRIDIIKKFFMGVSVACMSFTGMLFMTDEVKAAETIICEADGSDMEDDTKAIQACLNEAQNNESTIIKIPAGKYYISRTLTIYSNTTLELDKDAEIIRTDGSHIMIRSEQDLKTGGYGQAKNIVIKGGTWNGNVQDTTVLCPLMYFCHGTNITLKDMDIKSACSRHMVIIAGVDTALVDGVTFSDFVLYTGEDENNEYFTVEGENGEINKELALRTMEALHLDCISADGKSEGLALPCDDTVNKSITVQNCTFDGVMSGVGNHYMVDKNVKGQNLVIRNNTFKNIEYTCIDVYNQNGVIIEDNEAVNVGELVRVVNGTGRIKDNTVKCRNNAWEAVVGLCGIKITDSADMEVSLNNISGGTHGISLSGVNGKVYQNIVTNTAGNAITALDGCELSIEENKITANKQNGIYVENGNTFIDANVLKDCEGHGIAVYDSECEVSANEVSSVKMYGICVNNSVATLKSNIIEKTESHGIYALENSVVGTWYNILNNNGENAIYYNNATGKVMNNEITSPGLRGILIFEAGNKAGDVYIENNIISKAGENGIKIEGSSFVDVKANTVSDCSNQSINVYDSKSVKVLDNKVSGSCADGIYMFNVSDMDVNDNKISLTVNTALAVYNSNSINIFWNNIKGATTGILINNSKVECCMDNIIDSTTDKAIWALEGADVYITGNTITNADKQGIQINDATSYIVDNKITSPGDKAIYYYASTGNVEANNITSAGTNGIKLEESDNVTVIYNEIEKAASQAINIYGSKNVVILYNNVTGSVVDGIYVFESDNVEVTENKVKDTINSAVAVYKSNEAKISNNTVNAAKNGVLVNNSEVVCKDNFIDSTTEKAVWILENSNATVENNMITGVKKTGVQVNDSKTDVISNNISVETLGDKGIFYYQSSGTAESNEITGAGTNGIKVDSSENVSLVSNEIKNSREYTINVYGSKNVTVDSNILTSNTDTPVYVYDCTTVDVKNNTIDNTPKIAIAVYKTSKATVSKNTVGQAVTGILLNATKGTVSGNIIEKATERGIWSLESSDVEIKNNTIKSAGTHGIHVNCSNGKVNGNIITSASGKGIYIYDSKNTSDDKFEISGNTITGAKNQGIQMESSTYVKITKNNISNCEMQGIRCISKCDNVSIESNNVTDNGMHGILIDNSTNVVIKDNCSTNNKTKDISVNGSTGSASANVVSQIGTYTYDNSKFPISKVSGMLRVQGYWYYVKDNVVDKSFKGLAKNEYGWWYIRNGKLDKTYTGMAKNQWGWWYVRNGKLDTTYTGMAKNEWGWWYMKNGKLDTTYTGMAKNQWGWWHMTKGKLDTSFTGISSNEYGRWYIKKGKLDTSFTGTLKFNGIDYRIVKGKVN